jgi:hypothetical protein
MKRNIGRHHYLPQLCIFLLFLIYHYSLCLCHDDDSVDDYLQLNHPLSLHAVVLVRIDSLFFFRKQQKLHKMCDSRTNERPAITVAVIFDLIKKRHTLERESDSSSLENEEPWDSFFSPPHLNFHLLFLLIVIIIKSSSSSVRL